MELIVKDDCQATVDALMFVNAQICKLKEVYKPYFLGEHYLSGEEVCEALHISKRTLQEYRDNQMIPYISLPGKMLYKESDILAFLEENYIPAMIDYKSQM